MSKQDSILMNRTSTRRGDTISGVHPHSSSGIDLSRRFPFDEHMLYKLTLNPEILHFFETIKEYGDKVIEEKLLEIEKKYNALCKEYIKANKQTEKLKRAVEHTGVSLSTKGGSKIVTEPERYDEDDISDNSYIISVGRVYRCKNVFYPTVFNELPLSGAIVHEDGRPIVEAYEKWQKSNTFLDEKISTNSKKLRREKLILALPILIGRKRRVEEKEETEYERDDLDRTKREGEELKRYYSIWNSLTPEQKQAIGDYLDNIESLYSIGRSIEDEARKYDKMTKIEYSKTIAIESSGIWQEAINRAKADGRITDDDIEEARLFFTKELNKDQSTYYHGGIDFHSKNAPTTINASSFRWFMVKAVFGELKRQKDKEIATQELIRETESLIGREVLFSDPVKRHDMAKMIEGEDYDEEK